MQANDNDLTLENTTAKVKTVESVAENQNIVRQEPANSSTVVNLNQGIVAKRKHFKNKNFNRVTLLLKKILKVVKIVNIVVTHIMKG